MSKEQITWNYKCGLPRKFEIQKKVLGYADLSVTANEFSEYYTSWTKEEKQFADDLLMEIAIATSKEMK
jgi:hypothetical protein